MSSLLLQKSVNLLIARYCEHCSALFNGVETVIGVFLNAFHKTLPIQEAISNCFADFVRIARLNIPLSEITCTYPKPVSGQVTRRALHGVRAVLGHRNIGTASLKSYRMFSRLNKTRTSTPLTNSVK
jgi:hypothetical protein